MRSTRSGRFAPVALGAGAVLVVAALVWSFLSPSGGESDAGPDATGPVPGKVLPSRRADRPAHAKGHGKHRKQADEKPAGHGRADRAGRSGAPAVAGGGAGVGGTGAVELPGLPGRGWSISAPAHHLVLRVTSSAPIGLIGYTVPTSAHKYSGKVTDVGTSWSMSTTVYGMPDYARLWAQAGERGLPVTCTVTVDGHVTDRRSTAGPFGAVMCQG